MKLRRLGCIAFGTFWAVLFVLTLFGLALGHPEDENAVHPLAIFFWVEIVVLVLAAAIYCRAETRDPEI